MTRLTSVPGALAQFALGGLLATIVLGFAGVAVLRDTGRDEATRDAKRLTALVARGVVQPELDDGLVRGDPRAVARLDRVVRERVLGDQVVRVKLWSADGRIVYSDERRLVGRRFQLGNEEREVLRKGGTEAYLSDLSRPENRLEDRERRLFESYTPVRTPSGQLLLFEVYQRYSSVSASARSTWMSFLPALIGALIVLQLLQLPLAARLARRIKRDRAERERLLKRAVDASELERRRIAGDLHDGVVQELAGTSLALATAAARADANGGAEYADVLRQGAAATRGGLAELRTLLVKIHPASLREAGLVAALEDLVTPLRRQGADVTVSVCPEADLPPGVEALFFRVAQEAMSAAPTEMRVDYSGGAGRFLVRTDRRLDREALELLAGLVYDAGGTLTLDFAESGALCVEVPTVVRLT